MDATIIAEKKVDNAVAMAMARVFLNAAKVNDHCTDVTVGILSGKTAFCGVTLTPLTFKDEAAALVAKGKPASERAETLRAMLTSLKLMGMVTASYRELSSEDRMLLDALEEAESQLSDLLHLLRKREAPQ